MLLAVVLRMQTPEGTLVIEVDEPGTTVQILSENGEVQIERRADPGTLTIGVDPGKHRLRAEKDGLEFFARDFTVASGGREVVKVKLEPSPAASKAGSGVSARTSQKAGARRPAGCRAGPGGIGSRRRTGSGRDSCTPSTVFGSLPQGDARIQG